MAELPILIVEQKTPSCLDISLPDIYYAPDPQSVTAILTKLLNLDQLGA